MSSRSRPVSASEMRAGPTSSPASRRMRPNVTTWRTNPPSDGAGGDSPCLLDERNEGLVANGGEVLVVLQDRAERVLDRQIGRASCRGRGEISVGAGSFKKKKEEYESDGGIKYDH